MSKAQLGRKHSQETKDKQALWHKGRPRSPETIIKMSIANKGKKASPETRRKMSEARIKYLLSLKKENEETT